MVDLIQKQKLVTNRYKKIYNKLNDKKKKEKKIQK